jgi:hypothetical protein
MFAPQGDAAEFSDSSFGDEERCGEILDLAFNRERHLVV